MKLITKEILGKLEKNPRDHSGNMPWLKLFNPVGAETWLISEIEADGDTMFGLCDLGWGHPELGSVSLNPCYADYPIYKWETIIYKNFEEVGLMMTPYDSCNFEIEEDE